MVNRKLLDWLDEGRIVLGDGAMGTMLHSKGMVAGDSPEEWNVSHPDVLHEIHQAYCSAGSMVVTTNTFGGTQARLRANGLEDRLLELNVAAVKIAREVADANGALVAGDLGPTGELLEPYGMLSQDEAVKMYAEQVEALLKGGVDHIHIETMTQIAEVEAAIKGTRQVDSDVTIVATMTFDTKGRTMMGDKPLDALEAMHGWGIRVIGGNCGNGPDEIRAVMTIMTQNRPEGVFLIAQSNAGLPEMVDGEVRYDGTPEVMADYAVEMYEMGVNYIGACCGSTPDHIAAMKQALQAAGANL